MTESMMTPIPNARSQRIMEIASELLEVIQLEMDEGELSGEIKALPENERAFLHLALADAFGDTTD